MQETCYWHRLTEKQQAVTVTAAALAKEVHREVAALSCVEGRVELGSRVLRLRSGCGLTPTLPTTPQ